MTTCTLDADSLHTYTGMQNAIQEGQDYVQDCSLSTGSTPHHGHEEGTLGNQLAASVDLFGRQGCLWLSCHGDNERP